MLAKTRAEQNTEKRSFYHAHFDAETVIHDYHTGLPVNEPKADKLPQSQQQNETAVLAPLPAPGESLDDSPNPPKISGSGSRDHDRSRMMGRGRRLPRRGHTLRELSQANGAQGPKRRFVTQYRMLANASFRLSGSDVTHDVSERSPSEVHVCQGCGKGFRPKRHWQQQCSPRCRQRAYLKRGPIRTPGYYGA